MPPAAANVNRMIDAPVFMPIRFGVLTLERVATTAIICLLGWLGAFAQPTSPVPARIVTRYALTSSYGRGHNDPTDWRLLGSNDRGQTWTLLDSQTNQHFRRLQRRPFLTRNRAPYNIYRFQFDRASWADSATNGRPSLQSDGTARGD